MKKTLCCLLFISSIQAFADAASDFAIAQDRISQAEKASEAEAAKAADKQTEALTKEAATQAGLNLADFTYSPNGNLESATQVCHYFPKTSFGSWNYADVVTPAHLDCLPNPNLTYTSTQKIQRIIQCLVTDCKPANLYQEATEIALANREAEWAAEAKMKLKNDTIATAQKAGKIINDYQYTDGGYLQSANEICRFVRTFRSNASFDAEVKPDQIYCFPHAKADGADPAEDFEQENNLNEKRLAAERAIQAETYLKERTLATAKANGKKIEDFVYSKGGYLQSKTEVCKYNFSKGYSTFGDESEEINCVPNP